MIQNIVKKTLLTFLAAVFLLIIGCSKLTTENYDQLKMGMQYDEVLSILGKADECETDFGIQNCTWGTEKKHIKISFVGDKVLMISGKGL